MKTFCNLILPQLRLQGAESQEGHLFWKPCLGSRDLADEYGVWSLQPSVYCVGAWSVRAQGG